VVLIPGTGVEEEVARIGIMIPKRNPVQKSWHKIGFRKRTHDCRHLFRNILNKNMILHLKRKILKVTIFWVREPCVLLDCPYT
jgi:hypothetical protein